MDYNMVVNNLNSGKKSWNENEIQQLVEFGNYLHQLTLDADDEDSESCKESNSILINYERTIWAYFRNTSDYSLSNYINYYVCRNEKMSWKCYVTGNMSPDVYIKYSNEV